MPSCSTSSFSHALAFLQSLSVLCVFVDAHATLTVASAAAGSTISTAVHIGHGCSGAGGALMDTTAVLAIVPASLRASTPAAVTSIAMMEVGGWTSNYWIEANGDLKMRWMTSDATALIGNTTRIGEFPFSLKLAATLSAGTQLVFPTYQFCTNNTMKLWNGSAAITVAAADAAAPTTSAPATSAPTGVVTTPAISSQAMVMTSDAGSWRAGDTLSTIAIILSILSLLVHIKAWFASPTSPTIIYATSGKAAAAATTTMSVPSSTQKKAHARSETPTPPSSYTAVPKRPATSIVSSSSTVPAPAAAPALNISIHPADTSGSGIVSIDDEHWRIEEGGAAASSSSSSSSS